MTERAHILFFAFLFFAALVNAGPPFSGTILLDGDVITDQDLTSYLGMEFKGQENRQMYDRRVSEWIINKAFLFQARFDDGLEIEVQVNSEFQNESSALRVAEKYLPSIGRLPNSLRQDVKTIWIHKGDKPFGGGNNNLLIHDIQGDRYISSFILEETFVHEASHTSLDRNHAKSSGWVLAQKQDPNFISTYARDNPTREDVAESFLPFLALEYREDRIPIRISSQIRNTIPNRLEYFRGINWDLHPFVPRKIIISKWKYHNDLGKITLFWSSLLERTYQIEESTDLIHWQNIGGEIKSEGLISDQTLSFSETVEGRFYRVRRVRE